MLTNEKHLDRSYLNNYYQEMVDEIEEVFEIFLKDTPKEIKEISNLISYNNQQAAEEKLHKIIPAFLTIGLPQLSLKLQIVQVYLGFSKLINARLLMNAFIKELGEYMPAIQDEYRRLKAINRKSCMHSSGKLTV
jgi:hypothetical protein